MADRVIHGDEQEPVRLVLAPCVVLAGRVLDPLGQPVGGARVWMTATSEVTLAVPGPSDAASLEMPSIRADADGRFSVANAPRGPGWLLHARQDGVGSATLAAPPFGADALRIVLDPGPGGRRVIRGCVVMDNGAPAAHATVQLGEFNVVDSSDDGCFLLEVVDGFENQDLIAWLPDHQPAVLERFGATLIGNSSDVAGVRLVLGGPALEIEGRVEDGQERPLAAWRVGLAAGYERTRMQLPPAYLEELVGGCPDGWTTDGEGRFRIGGLRDGHYRLRAWDPESLVMVHSEEVAAGVRDLRIRLPENATIPTLRGRCTTADLTPLQGVGVTLLVAVPTSTGLWTLTRETVLTGLDGTFVLHRVPREHLVLHCRATSILDALWPIEDLESGSDLHLIVERKLHFRIHRVSEAARSADALGALREGDTRAALLLPGGFGGDRLQLADLDNGIVATGESTRNLVLYLGGAELARVAIELEPGVINELDL